MTSMNTSITLYTTLRRILSIRASTIIAWPSGAQPVGPPARWGASEGVQGASPWSFVLQSSTRRPSGDCHPVACLAPAGVVEWGPTKRCLVLAAGRSLCSLLAGLDASVDAMDECIT